MKKDMTLYIEQIIKEKIFILHKSFLIICLHVNIPFSHFFLSVSKMKVDASRHIDGNYYWTHRPTDMTFKASVNSAAYLSCLHRCYLQFIFVEEQLNKNTFDQQGTNDNSHLNIVNNSYTNHFLETMSKTLYVFFFRFLILSFALNEVKDKILCVVFLSFRYRSDDFVFF